MNRYEEMYQNTLAHLLDARGQETLWTGRLSSSPLATAVAITALHTADADGCTTDIQNGLHWLATHQNPDGGWGDTENHDPSNLSTTLVALAAFAQIDSTDEFLSVAEKGQAWLKQHLVYTDQTDLAQAVYAAYGNDLTFAVPIMTLCTLAGLFRETPPPWQFVKPLPFELAMLPRGLFRMLKLTVVSYALPALIAVGQVKDHVDPPRNPILRLVRRLLRKPTLNILQSLQPSNGGFLEAPPLTGFVTLSLAAIGLAHHPVAQKGLAFLTASMRSDGSWPIDSNLSTWLSAHAVKSLGSNLLTDADRHRLTHTLLDQQTKTIHPYTNAGPGGWGWSPLPGAVPDADDTAGVLVALHHLDRQHNEVHGSVKNGLNWLLDLQNTDGGIPTFCRGWGKLEFDRSCADITAHALEAFLVWRSTMPPSLQFRIDRAIERVVSYLYAVQRPDGAWLPLWFGHPAAADNANPVYGTARVLKVIALLSDERHPWVKTMIAPATGFLERTQHADGGWAADANAPSSIEETSLAIAALAAVTHTRTDVIDAGLAFLSQKTENGTTFPPAPIGLYFAKLWYTEDLYPPLFALQALQGVRCL